MRHQRALAHCTQNPSNKPAGVPSAGPEPEYTEPQRKRFKGYSWIDVEQPSLLGVQGTELLLVGASDDYKGAWVVLLVLRPVGTGRGVCMHALD